MIDNSVVAYGIPLPEGAGTPWEPGRPWRPGVTYVPSGLYAGLSPEDRELLEKNTQAAKELAGVVRELNETLKTLLSLKGYIYEEAEESFGTK